MLMLTIFHLYLVSILSLSFMVVSDFRNRTVNIYWLVLFGTAMAVAAILRTGAAVAGINLLVNISTACFMLIAAVVYWRLKHGSWVNPADRLMGLGDMLLIVCIAPMFELRSFLIIMLVSMILSLVWWAVRKARSGSGQSIPLAGWMGLVLIAWLVKQIILL